MNQNFKYLILLNEKTQNLYVSLDAKTESFGSEKITKCMYATQSYVCGCSYMATDDLARSLKK